MKRLVEDSFLGVGGGKEEEEEEMGFHAYTLVIIVSLVVDDLELGVTTNARANATTSSSASTGTGASARARSRTSTLKRVYLTVKGLNLAGLFGTAEDWLAALNLAWPVASLGSIVPPQVVLAIGSLGALKVLAESGDADVEDVTVLAGDRGAIGY